MLEPAEIAAAVAEHTSRIQALVPGADVQLSGSALIPELEPRDVDLVVLVPQVAPVTAPLSAVYPVLYEEHWQDVWAAFREPGPPQVDLAVTVPGSWGELHHLRAWELIANDRALLDEYRALKESPDDYAERKAAYFEAVVARLS